jgi:hypothetical protein
MAVSDRVREIEREIDTSIRALPTWQAPRAEILERLMHTYRDAIELMFCRYLHAMTFDRSPKDFSVALGNEDQIRGGMLWALKWATEYCPENGPSGLRSPEELVELILLGMAYETFVDALKYAQWGLLTIEVDESSRIITCYEGDSATVFDVGIIQQERISTPTTPHVSLTQDDDQLTSRWAAGDYRRLTTMLANYAASKENTIHVDPDFLRQIGKPEISVPQPTVVWLVRPSMAPDRHVFDDLVLPTVIDSQLKWKLVSLLETPIVLVGDRYCALSSDLKTLSKIDDYMLRLAARIDNHQYNRANSLREDRMIKICRHALEHCSRPWTVTDRVHLTNPSQEADILAVRDKERLVLQLKSTLRPETPWEVYKRNEDIISGVKHTKSLIDRGAARLGFVVTDGYRGDYTCWAQGLTYGTPIATLYDLEVIATDPIAAVTDVKNRVGITASTPRFTDRLPDREAVLLDWKLRLVDKGVLEQTQH